MGNRTARLILSSAVVLLAFAATLSAGEAQEAIDFQPEGFGANSRGGEGGRVITVTSLADDGPGSLREALTAEDPRIVEFAVEGVIELRSRIRVSSGRVTVDGSTAPGQGITLMNHGIQFVGDCDDIIVRHLRVRVLEGGESGDCLLFWGVDGGTVERVLVDHCSLMWATDEVLNTWGQVRDLTCQWTIIAEGQSEADHPKGFHSMGWLSGNKSDRITIHHCLFAHNADRNPLISGGVYDLVNNVIYNWGNNNASKIAQGAHANVVNNHYIAGPQSAGAKGYILPQEPDQGTKVYPSGNVGPLTPTGTEDPWLNVTWFEHTDQGWIKHQTAPEIFRATERFDAPLVRTHSAQEAYELVLTHVGPKVRDADDVRVIREVRERTGSVGRRSGGNTQ
jgi:pectate lyase